MQPLQICIGPIIRIGRESWCLPYAGFFSNPSNKILKLLFTHLYYELWFPHFESAMLSWSVPLLYTGSWKSDKKSPQPNIKLWRSQNANKGTVNENTLIDLEKCRPHTQTILVTLNNLTRACILYIFVSFQRFFTI